jgi:hypothetical protein
MSNKHDAPEQKLAQFDAFMQDLPELSPEIRQCVATHGFHKLAAAVYGLPEINEQTVGMFFGTKLASQKLEWSTIVSGLKALQNLGG